MALYRTAPAPMPIIDKPPKATHHSGFKPKGEPWRGYIIHATARKPGGNSINWLTWQSAPDPVSIHRLIEPDGLQYKVCQDNQIAHHAGGSDIGTTNGLNRWYRGIELENTNGRDGVWEEYPDAQIDVCAQVIVEWWYIDGLYLPFHGHFEVDSDGNKTDPARFPWAKLSERISFHLARYL